MTTTKRTTFASVWDAIEDSREIAARLRLRAEVANAIIEETRRHKLTQARAAVICGVTQPRISDLKGGRLDLFSLDALIDMAANSSCARASRSAGVAPPDTRTPAAANAGLSVPATEVSACDYLPSQ
jgi:predicted XRE-type DNA-binding protein